MVSERHADDRSDEERPREGERGDSREGCCSGREADSGCDRELGENVERLSDPEVERRSLAPDTETYVVGVGASAGGLEALERFFSVMPTGSTCAFVVVQHLSPDFESHMAELLARRTRLKVETVSDGVVVEADTIYVMPPNREVEFAGGKLVLSVRDPHAPVSHPIDRFFHSLAHECAHRAIAVVLSGTGSDGSDGVLEVHSRGGLVLVQDPETAGFDGMPVNALATGVVDEVLPPESMAEELGRYLRNASSRPDEPAAEPADSVEVVLRALRDSYGVDFDQYRPTTVRRRIQRRASMKNYASVEDYVAKALGDADELDDLHHDLLIGVTSFFRDPESFEELGEVVLGELIDEAERTGRIRVWVVGCASGEEAYSIAILLDECLRERKSSADVKVFATDIHRGLLTRASRGVFSEDELEGLSDERIARYFAPTEDGYRVRSYMRRKIIFAHHNVMRDAPFTQLDLVTCRNMLIYLQPEAQQRALSLFHFGLRRGGLLFLGSSETPGALKNEFRSLRARPRIFSKLRDKKLSIDLRRPTPQRPLIARPHVMKKDGVDGSASAMKVYERLLSMHLPPSFLVDGEFNLLHTFGGAERFIRLRAGRFSGDLFAIVDRDLEPTLRQALREASEGGKEVHRSQGKLDGDRSESGIDIVVTPLRDGTEEAPSFLVKLVSRFESPLGDTSDAPTDDPEKAKRYVASLENELHSTRQNLQTTIEQLETANEELQATNEELIASNEELQSTNEELQSVNEELHTVNTEHQEKFEELTRAYEDMDNLLAVTRVGVLFLDEERRIRSYTPEIARLFRFMPHDVGRAFATFQGNFSSDDIDQRVAEVLEGSKESEATVADRENRVHLLRIAPYRGSGATLGVALSIVDVSELENTRRELAMFERMSAYAADMHLMIRRDGIIEYANPAVERETAHEVSEIIGLPYVDLDEQCTKEELEQWFHTASSSEDGLQIERVFSKKDGGELTVEMSLSLVRSGDEVALFGSARDVTERRVAERDLALYRSAIDATRSGVTIADVRREDIPIVFANEGFAKMVGYDMHEIVGRNCRFLQGEGTSREAKKELRDAIDAGEHCRVTILNYRKDGTAFWNDVSVNPVERNGVVTHFVGVQTDVTSAIETARRAKEREASVEALMNSTAEGIVGIDLRGMCTFCNESALEMLGFSGSAAIVGSAVIEIFANADPWTDEPNESTRRLMQALNGTEPAELESEPLRRKGAAPFPADVRIQPITSEGARRGMVLTFIDVSEGLRQAARMERALQEADAANRAKTEFLANMSHEIRTPLTAIVALSDVLKLDASAKSVSEHVDTIKRNAYALLGIVDDILDLSKIEAERIEIVSEKVELALLVADLRSMMNARASEKGLALRFETVGEVPSSIETDKGRLRQVLVNLVGNAIKFTSRGSVEIRVGVRGDMLSFDVEDTGIGIAKEAMEAIFMPFHQSDPGIEREFGGSGLGLNISRRLATRLGGRIEVESTLGVGSTFTLLVPIVKAGTPTTELMNAQQRLELEAELKNLRGRVLLVDDHDDIRTSVASLLEHAGATVTTAPNAIEASELLQGKEANFDLILLDLQMPKMSGFELLRELRASGCDTPIVALTAQAMRGDRERCLEAGFDDYLSKPVDPSRLARCVSRYLGDGESAEREAKRVLIVEDSEAAGRALALLLESEGHECRVASTIQQAKALTKEYVPDVLLMDIRLPDGDGVELMKSLRSDDRFAESRFIATTGLSGPENELRLKSAGFDSVVVKPLDFEMLKSSLSR